MKFFFWRCFSFSAGKSFLWRQAENPGWGEAALVFFARNKNVF